MHIKCKDLVFYMYNFDIITDFISILARNSKNIIDS